MIDFPKANANPQRLLRRAAAALYISENYFPCAAKTLAKLACIGSSGPAFQRAGRVPLYPQSILDEWARGKIGPLQRSTSDLSARTPSPRVREQRCDASSRADGVRMCAVDRGASVQAGVAPRKHASR
jgi:hypothetical protein